MTTEPATEQWLTVAAVAQLYDVSIWTIYGLVRQDAIPHHRFGTRSLRFDPRELDDWMRSDGSDAPRPDPPASQYKRGGVKDLFG